MNFIDLVQDGDTRLMGSELRYIIGGERDLKVRPTKPFARVSRPVTVVVGRVASPKFSVTVIDVLGGRELVVSISGAVRISAEWASRAAEAHARFGNLERAAAHFVRKGIDELGSDHALGSILVSQDSDARKLVRSTLCHAFKEIGVDCLEPKLELLFRGSSDSRQYDEPVGHSFGPRDIRVLGQSEAIKVTVNVVFELDQSHIVAAAASTSIDDVVDATEALIWTGLAGRFDADDFRSRAALIDEELKHEINAKIGPAHGRIVRYLRVNSAHRPNDPQEINPEYNHRIDASYTIRGTNRGLPLTHEFAWILPTDRANRELYVARGQNEGLKKAITAEIEQATRLYLQDKTFGDVLFDFYAEPEVTQRDLGEEILERLKPIATSFGVGIKSGVTTTLRPIEEAILFQGGVFPIESKDYSLKEGWEKVKLGALVSLRLDRRKDHDTKNKLKNWLDGEEEGMLLLKIQSEAHTVMRSILLDTETKTLLQSSLCGRDDHELESRLEQRISAGVKDKFGFSTDESGVQITRHECPLLSLSRQLLGKGGVVEVVCQSPLYDVDGEFSGLAEPVTRIRIPFTVDDIGIARASRGRNLDRDRMESAQEEFFHRYVQTISAYPDVDAVLERVVEVVRNTATSFLGKVYYEALRPDIIDEAGVMRLLSHVLQRRVLTETGLWIGATSDGISTPDGVPTLVNPKLGGLRDSRRLLESKLTKKKEERALYGGEVDEDISRLQAAIDEINRDIADAQAQQRSAGGKRQEMLLAYNGIVTSFLNVHQIPALPGPSAEMGNE